MCARVVCWLSPPAPVSGVVSGGEPRVHKRPSMYSASSRYGVDGRGHEVGVLT